MSSRISRIGAAPGLVLAACLLLSACSGSPRSAPTPPVTPGSSTAAPQSTPVPAGTAAPPGTGAVGIWAAAPVPGVAVAGDPDCPAASGAFTSGTVRDIIHPGRPGERIRIRISNVYGTGPLSIDAATVAQQTSGAAVEQSTIRALAFGGHPGITVAAGQEADSDWISVAVSPAHDLAVSFHVVQAHGPATFHPLARQPNFVSKAAADQTADPAGLTGQLQDRCWLYLDGVDEQLTPDVSGSVVAFGDSITDGQASTIGGNARWPDDLAERLLAESAPTLSVVDEGIGGNKVLTTGATRGAGGDSALSRFGRDALGQPGVKVVVLLEGVNDIGGGEAGREPPVTADTLINGYRTLIAQAHAHDVRVVGCTLTPFKGAGYWDVAGEQVREQVNRWILSAHAFDATVDFAAAVADPQDAQMLNPKYDSGGHLHPNDAGYQAMANAIDLTTLVGH